MSLNIRIRKTALVTALLTSLAAAGVNIRGKITQETNEPLEFVTVRVQGSALGTMSSLEGFYQLSAPKADTIRLVFSCIGYEDATRRLINAADSVTVNVKMTPKAHMLGEVEVSDFRKQTGAMQTVNVDNYRLNPDASGGSVESIITTMAGVTSGNELSSQYSVRGGSYDENSVYINGIEVFRPQLVTSGRQEGLSIINPDMVDNIEFSTGGFPARYGDKMSSALDITYRHPQQFEGAVSVSLMGGSLTVGSATGRFSQLHGVRYKSNASLLSSTEDKGEYDPKFFDYQTNMSLKLSNRFSVSVLGNIAVNNYKFIPTSRTTSFGTVNDAKQFKVYFDGQEKDRFETFFGALTLDYKAASSTNLKLLASGYLTNELVSYDIQGEYWLDQAGGTGGDNGSVIGGELGVGRYHEHARNRLKASVMSIGLRGSTGIARHNLEYGVDFSHQNIRDRAREWEKRDSAGYSLPFDPDALKVIYAMDANQEVGSNRFAFYAQDTYRLSTSAGYFNINGGVRLSYWDYNKELLVSPRFNIGFVPDATPRLAFRFATGLYYQSPFYKEYRKPVTDEMGHTIITLNNEIKSPRSLQFILGADYSFRAFNRPFKLSAEAYYKSLSDLIPYEVQNLKVIYSGENTSKGYAMGLDMKLFGQFVPGSDSWVSFSLMKTQEELSGVKVPRPNDRRYSVALFFTDYFPRWPKLKFSLRGIFSDGLPTVAPRSSRDVYWFRAPAYKRVDIGLQYALLSPPAEGTHRSGIAGKLKSVWLGFDVFNLLDISNVSGYYWVTDVNEIRYAVPNYLTRRQFNIRVNIEF
ncbi:MAG: carboxypeptidase-like regulatory domain-containing protein [Muribaculaceae bacterium]